MSTRAFRIDEMKIKDGYLETINITHSSPEFISFLENKGFFSTTNEDCVGLGIIEVSALEEAIDKSEELKLDKEDIELIQEDIDWAKKNNKTELMYHCC